MADRTKLQAAIISAAGEAGVRSELLTGPEPRILELVGARDFQYDDEAEAWRRDGVELEAAVGEWAKANPALLEGSIKIGTRVGSDIRITRSEAARHDVYAAAEARAAVLGGRVVVAEDEAAPAESEGPVIRLSRDDARDHQKYSAAQAKAEETGGSVVVEG